MGMREFAAQTGSVHQQATQYRQLLAIMRTEVQADVGGMLRRQGNVEMHWVSHRSPIKNTRSDREVGEEHVATRQDSGSAISTVARSSDADGYSMGGGRRRGPSCMGRKDFPHQKWRRQLRSMGAQSRDFMLPWPIFGGRSASMRNHLQRMGPQPKLDTANYAQWRRDVVLRHLLYQNVPKSQFLACIGLTGGEETSEMVKEYAIDADRRR